MLSLSVVTALSRPQNAESLAKCVYASTRPLPGCWYIVRDPLKAPEHVPMPPPTYQDWTTNEFAAHPGGDASGAPQKNAALDQIPIDPDNWIYCLDDDNLLPVGFGLAVQEALWQHPDAKILVFSQVNHKGELLRRAVPENFAYRQIDCGQFLVRADVVGGERFLLNTYWSDWVFIRNLAAKVGLPVFGDKPTTFYNAIAGA